MDFSRKADLYTHSRHHDGCTAIDTGPHLEACSGEILPSFSSSVESMQASCRQEQIHVTGIDLLHNLEDDWLQ